MKKTILLFFVVGMFLCASNVYADTIIFQENFNSPDALTNWVDESITGNQWSIANGVLVSEWPVNGDYFGQLVYSSLSTITGPFTITFSARMIQSGNTGWGTGSDAVGIRLGEYSANFFVTTWRQNEYNDFIAGYTIDGFNSGQIGLTGVNAYNFDEYSWHTIEIVKNDTTVSAFLNGDIMYNELMPNFSFNTFAFGPTDGIFQFDNLLITSPEPIPEPATMLLLGSGLVGLAGFRRKLKK